jgi:hypothetical protein
LLSQPSITHPCQPVTEAGDIGDGDSVSVCSLVVVCGWVHINGCKSNRL